MKPLALDLCCGLGGWAEGLIAAGWDVIGVDTEGRFRDDYPGQFFRGDVRRMGAPNKIVSLVVASPPCQEFSRHDQPWTRKRNPPPPDTSTWEACWRISHEAEAPIILENVRGAQRFMGRAAWHCGPFYLWGNVPALMPKIRYRHKETRSSGMAAWRAKIPFELALHIGEIFHPGELTA